MRHLDRDQLTAAALPGETVDARAARHLARCDACTDEVDRLRRTVEAVRDGLTVMAPGADVDAPAGPPEHVWAAISRHLDDDPEPGRTLDQEATASTTGSTTFRVRAAVGALVSVALAAVALVAATQSSPAPVEPPPSTTIALVATEPGVTGRVVRTRGGQMDVYVALPGPPPVGTHLEAWLVDDAGMRPLGALTAATSTEMSARLAMPPESGPIRIDVSLEPGDGDARHSGHSIAHTP